LPGSVPIGDRNASSHLNSPADDTPAGFYLEEISTYEGKIGRFLAMRFKGYCDDHVGWAKEIWDMGATAWALHADWAPSVLMNTPTLTDDMHYSMDRSRHMMRYVYAINRNGIFKDFIVRLSALNAAVGERAVSPVM
jgi:hypothetical protein